MLTEHKAQKVEGLVCAVRRRCGECTQQVHHQLLQKIQRSAHHYVFCGPPVFSEQTDREDVKICLIGFAQGKKNRFTV